MFRNSSKVTHGKTERERERERKKERKKGIMKITTQKKAISIKKPQTDIVLLQNIKHEHGRKHKHKHKHRHTQIRNTDCDTNPKSRNHFCLSQDEVGGVEEC